MKYFLVLAIFLIGCENSHNVLLSTGKKPPLFFEMTDKKTMDKFYFDTQKFAFIFPTSRENDFIQRGGWSGMTYRDGHGIAFAFKDGVVYHIAISTNYEARKYGESDKAIETKDQSYILDVRQEYKYPKNTKLYYGTCGQENYACMIKEKVDKFNCYSIAYYCYKSNPKKTKTKSVTIVLSYSKPKNPALAKQYTYQDLKRRAKRMLDSLYIKDGW